MAFAIVTFPARAAFTIPAQPMSDSGRNCTGSRILVVDPAVDDVDAALAGGRAHEDDVVARDEVAALDELDAHLAGEEGVLEVRRIVDARREHDDRRIGTGVRRRRGSQRRQEPLGVVRDRADAVAREQLGEDPRHRAAVLDDVGAPRRDADVVLEHPELPVAVADEIDAGDVDADVVRCLDAEAGALEVAGGDDDAPRARCRRRRPALIRRHRARNISSTRTRWMTPASIVAHSSASIRRGTGSSGNGTSSPECAKVTPRSRSDRSRSAQRSSNSSGDSDRRVS